MKTPQLTIRNFFWLILAVGMPLSVPLCGRGETPRGDPVEVGKQKQLFLDDYLIASTANVSRRIGPA